MKVLMEQRMGKQWVIKKETMGRQQKEDVVW